MSQIKPLAPNACNLAAMTFWSFEYQRAGKYIDYRYYNGRFWLFGHYCQVPTPSSQNQEVKQQIHIFEITKSKITSVSMLELMQQELHAWIVWMIEIHYLWFVDLFIIILNGKFWEVGFGDWQSMQNNLFVCLFEFAMLYAHQ
jgi:hypothetical protein